MGYIWLSGMVKGFPLEGGGEIYVGVDVEELCASCHLRLGMVFLSSFMPYGIPWVTL